MQRPREYSREKSYVRSFRIRFNSKLYELLNDMDVVERINIQRLRWFGHVVRMEEDAPAPCLKPCTVSKRFGELDSCLDVAAGIVQRHAA